MGQIINVANFHKLEENCTSIKQNKTTASLTTVIQSTDSDWPFPQTYLKNISLTLGGFSFFHPNLSTLPKGFFQPSQNLLNVESGTEEMSTVSTQYSFYPVQQQIAEKIYIYKKK